MSADAFPASRFATSAGNENSVIQKFRPGVPGWQQVNLNGFGTQANTMISTLGTFKNILYAGTYHWDLKRAQIWFSSNGTTWSPAMTGGFGNTADGIDQEAFLL